MKNAHICFVIPPSVFLLDERVIMSLGVLSIAAVLEKFFPVDVLDLSGIANYEETIARYLEDNCPTTIGLTATTPQMPSVANIIRTIRQNAPAIRIILGGPHVTLVHAAAVRENRDSRPNRATAILRDLELLADVLVAGDGEKAIFRALEPDSPPIVNADNPHSSLFLRSEDLDRLPWPARHLIAVDSYHYQIDGERALSIVSQLGCPFGCGFCGGRHSPSFRRMRSRQVEGIIGEMEHLYRTYGVRGFMFYDDELNVNQSQIVKLLEKIIALQKRLGTEFRLRGFVKAQLFDDEQAKLMYRAGFRWLLSGFESASPAILKAMNKRASVEDNTRCLEIARRHGLKVKALMSIGHPGESPATIEETRNWLKTVRPDDFDTSIITIYPGTPYYEDSVPHPSRENVWVYTSGGAVLYSQEIDFSRVADFYKGDPNQGYQSFVFTDYLSPGDIVALRDNLEQEIRSELGLPPLVSAPALYYEHSMGQNGLPHTILRQSAESKVAI